MADYQMLAAIAMDHASANYARKGLRFDVIVETMELSEVQTALREAGVTDADGAIKWATDFARAQHEQELNQAWDGPESCIGSPLYKPEADPAWDGGDPPDPRETLWVGPEFADDVSLEERWDHYAFEERNGMAYGSSF